MHRHFNAPDSYDTGEEAELWAQVDKLGLDHAREALFIYYAPFARGVARKAFRARARGDVELTDFEQLAYEALLDALKRFDPGRGIPFPAFAKPRIQGNIADGASRMTEVRGQLSWRHRIRRERSQSLAPKADNLGVDEALSALSELALGLALGFMLEGTGIYADPDQEAKDGGAPFLPQTAYDSLAWKEVVARVHGELAELEEREQSILRLHYIQGMNFAHIAILLAITKGRVSQLHRGALVSLRKRMAAKGHFRLER